VHEPNPRKSVVSVADTDAAFDAFDEEAQVPARPRALRDRMMSMGMFRFGRDIPGARAARWACSSACWRLP